MSQTTRASETAEAAAGQAERERDQARRERDVLVDVFGWPTKQQMNSALVRAATNGNGPAVERLMTAGADKDARTEGNTPLIAAILGGHEGIVDQLLARGADPDGEDLAGSKPLVAAALNGRAGCVGRLLAAHASVNAQCPLGLTALHYAAFGPPSLDNNPQERDRVAVSIVAMLLEAGADKALRARLQDGAALTALQCAEAWGNTQVTALLRGAED